VRRALAIQLIINREWGLAKNENMNQGSFIVEELTRLVEEAVLAEFDRITERGGVLGAMETGYQRSKIQEESLHYEALKHSGELPIVGVNTFRDSNSPAPPKRRNSPSSSGWPISSSGTQPKPRRRWSGCSRRRFPAATFSRS
jgi:methylmalonyl-CoA mutase